MLSWLSSFPRFFMLLKSFKKKKKYPYLRLRVKVGQRKLRLIPPFGIKQTTLRLIPTCTLAPSPPPLACGAGVNAAHNAALYPHAQAQCPRS